jgi:uncharacterized protein with HEPN domain
MVDQKRRDFMLCRKILKEIADIEAFTENMSFDAFAADERTQKAVAMSFINIGEMASSFSAAFIDSNQHLPLKEIRGLRNIAAHRYEIIRMETLWDTIQNSLPTLRTDIAAILPAILMIE